MRLAFAARIVCDPKHLLSDPWAHDMAHALLRSVMDARKMERPGKRCRSRGARRSPDP